MTTRNKSDGRYGGVRIYPGSRYAIEFLYDKDWLFYDQPNTHEPEAYATPEEAQDAIETNPDRVGDGGRVVACMGQHPDIKPYAWLDGDVWRGR